MSEGKRFFKDISASAVQIGVTQVANLLIFYLISKYISKEDFGFYNWSMAVSSTIITVLSLGMDLVYVKRIASGFKEKITISLHFFHALVTSGVLIVAIGFVTLFFPNLFNFNTLFLLVLINQSVFTIGNSIKFCLNGLEKYNKLALIAIITNLLRVSLTLALLFLNYFTIYFIVAAFIASYLIEFIISYFIARKVLNYFIIPKMYFGEYKGLIKESFPQLGTVLFDSALARIDWILMGIIATSVKTAEYTFAFKMFEVSKMPYLIIAPILLTRFSKLFKDERKIEENEKSNLDNLFKVELFLAVLIPITAIAIWSDFFDLITNNKYGAVNQLTYSILALCIPLHYSTNFLWTMAFTQGQLKTIFWITLITSVTNILLNIFLIKAIGAEGAALAFLISTLIQVFLYYKLTKQHNYQFNLKALISFVAIGILSVLPSYFLTLHFIFEGMITVILFLALSWLTHLIRLKTIKTAFI